MPTKPKVNQPETPSEVQGRDLFQTPRYATELLIPFIPKSIGTIWECAAGDGAISEVLFDYGYSVWDTDLRTGTNFLTFEPQFPHKVGAIITNPPFSIKRAFYDRCRFFGVPFALLIPCDYSKWIINAIRKDGCEKIIPDARIDFITPFCVKRINEKWNKSYQFVVEIPDEYLLDDLHFHSSQFHSMWLTWGFGLGKSETFVELTKEMKRNVK